MIPKTFPAEQTLRDLSELPNFSFNKFITAEAT